MTTGPGLTAEQIERRDYTWCTAIWHEPYRWENFVIGTPVLADAKPRALAFAAARWAEPDEVMLDVANNVVRARKAFAAGLHDNSAYESPPGRRPRKAYERVTVREHVPLFRCPICREGQQPRGVPHEKCERAAAELAVAGRLDILRAAGIAAEPSGIDGLVAASGAVIDSYRLSGSLGVRREDLVRRERARLVAVSLRDEAARKYLDLCAAECRDVRSWRWTRGRGKPGVGLEVITASYNPHGWRVTNLARSWPEWEICANIIRSGPPGCPRSCWRIETRKRNRILTGYWCEEHLPDDGTVPAAAALLAP